MEIDWTFLSWFLPLATGSVLTFVVGRLDSSLKHRQTLETTRAAEINALAERRREYGREYALAALKTVSEVRDAVKMAPRRIGRKSTVEEELEVVCDRTQLDELSLYAVLIPDVVMREMLTYAVEFLISPSIASQGCDRELGPRPLQAATVAQLTRALGYYLRLEPIDPDLVAWFRRIHRGFDAVREQYFRLHEEVWERPPSDFPI